MSICICGPSALELFRSHGRLVPDLLKQPRTARTDDLIIETPLWLEDELPRLGVTTKWDMNSVDPMYSTSRGTA